ncbi:MAG: glycosyltransferase [Bacteroidota bacterium]|nr:glycosyltransferase [Bacteroidota bacterium]
MISIITPIYNQLAMNKLFYESLLQNTFHPFELIIIDNKSDDGSREYFEGKEHVVLIKNEFNYSYPYCNNLGIQKSRFEYMAFLNNDIILSEDWDKKLMACMEVNDVQFICPCGTERMGTKELTTKRMLRWKLISTPLRKISVNILSLKWMMKLMYSSYEKYAASLFRKYGFKIKEGFCGFAILTTKTNLNKIEGMDIRVQEADWDLFVKVKKRSIDIGDMKPIQIALGIFVHHFGRLTAKSNFPDFKDRNNLYSFDDKWTEHERKKYLQNL